MEKNQEKIRSFITSCTLPSFPYNYLSFIITSALSLPHTSMTIASILFALLMGFIGIIGAILPGLP
ncbi:MAG: hypothetical protein LBU27_02110 [Candidatus Peribacteria bacterium]|jgi:hypothetical protein|nr:hypothetical protein [Candidatus Peribacteria bacterium]